MTPDATQAKLHETLFGVQRSVRYHRHRERFFDRTHEMSAAIAMTAGMATITTLLADLPAEWIWTRLACATVALGTYFPNFCFNPASAAQHHSNLAVEFLALERDLVNAGDEPEATELRKLEMRRLDIEAGEPPVLRVLDAICHDELITALEADPSQRTNITRWQRLWRHLFDFGAHRLRKREK